MGKGLERGDGQRKLILLQGGICGSKKPVRWSEDKTVSEGRDNIYSVFWLPKSHRVPVRIRSSLGPQLMIIARMAIDAGERASSSRAGQRVAWQC